ncbi:DNA replication initiation factor cdc45, partial [Coemansia spiralis]
MVYVGSGGYEDAYRRIVDGAGGRQGTSVVVFVSADADAICGLRILTALLKRDAIGHKIVPVANYAEIAEMNRTLVAGNTQIRTVVLLNCGAQVDIQDLLTLRDGLTVVVIDSHRPFNLYNVFWHEHVQCLDDGDVDQNMAALRDAFEAVEFGANSDSSDDDADDDDDAASEVGSKRGAPADGDQQQQQPARKRRPQVAMDPDEFVREQEQRTRRRDVRAQQQHMIQAYYAQGSYHGQSCAVSMLALAEQLGLPPTLDTVWWAIVGASTQHMLQHTDADGHAVVVHRMRDLVRRVCPAAPAGLASGLPLDSIGGMAAEDARPAPAGAPMSSSSQALLDSQLGLPGAAGDAAVFDPYLDPIDEEADEGYLRARAGAATNAEAGLLTSSKTVEQRTAIVESAELRFTLLRHWSLDSAMRF